MSETSGSADFIAELLDMKRRVEAILTRILEIDTDHWNLQIGGEDPGPIYVQGIQEDHGCIHIELVHESDAGRPLGDIEREFLKFAGWRPPDEDIPNYWVEGEAVTGCVTQLHSEISAVPEFGEDRPV